MRPGVGPLELVVVLVIALIFLGPSRLPDAGKAIGQGMRGFRSALAGDDDDEDDVPVKDEDPPAIASTAAGAPGKATDDS